MTKASWRGRWVCHRCGRTKPAISEDTTTLERVRNMSGKELAEWLVYKVKCTSCNAENCNTDFCISLMEELLELPDEE